MLEENCGLNIMWLQGGIINRFLITSGSRLSVEKELDDILEAQYQDRVYNPSHILSGCKRHHAIICMTKKDLILNCQMNDISIIVLNGFSANDMPPRNIQWWSTVAEYVGNSPVIIKSRRAGKKVKS